MKLSQEAARVWIAGKPLSPHQTKPNAEPFGGAAVASATPTSLGPAGLAATIGPPLSPEQTVLWTGRLRIVRLTFRIAIRPDLPPASHITETGRGQKPCTNTVAAVNGPILGLRIGAGFLAPKPATETTAPGAVSAESSVVLATWMGGALVGFVSVRTATSPMKPWFQPGLTATALTACTSPPMKAEVEFVRTVIVDGLETQCAAVSTLVGESTEPVQSVCGVSTAAVKPQSVRLAGVPPTTPALARGAFAAAEPPATDGSSPAPQISAIPSLAERDSITTSIGSAALALELERPRHRVHRPGRRV